MKAILLIGGETGFYATTDCAYPMPTIEVPILAPDWRKAFLNPEPPRSYPIPYQTIVFALVCFDIRNNVAVYKKISEKTTPQGAAKKED